MNSQQKDLLLLQTGPVQEFITAARTTGDLWSGSYMIAWLTAAGIRYVKDNGGEIIFPCLENQQVYKRLTAGSGELGQPTLPNRFLAEIPYEKSREIAEGAVLAIRQELKAISDKCFEEFCKIFESGPKYQKRWDSQVEHFLQISWQTIPLDEQNWSGSYNKLLANLAARRNTRNFDQYLQDDGITELQKDALNGKDEIIGDRDEWKKNGKYFSVSETKSTGDKPYGALSIIKRLWRTCYLGAKGPVINTVSAYDLARLSSGEAAEYIAAIQMDGDRMGSILSSPGKDKEFFNRFSRKLANFTRDEAEKIVKKYKGCLIYAGGDDVLALVPACNAVNCARELREKFCSDDANMPGSEKNLAPDVPSVSLSAGIAYAHWKTPLAWLLEEARNAEHRAKNDYCRNALALSVVKRGGEVLHWGAGFDSAAWELYDKFIELDQTETVSGRFASALAQFLKPYQLEKAESKDMGILSQIIKADFALVCNRQKLKKEGVPQTFVELAEKYIAELAIGEHPADFPLLFLCANFLTRKKEEMKGEKNG